MRSLKPFWQLIIVASFIYIPSAFSADDISVRVSPVIENGQVLLKFTIKNLTTSTLHFLDSDLPWGYPGHTVVVAAWRWGDVLKQAPPPPPSNRTTSNIYLSVGQSVEGTVPVNRYVEDLNTARRKGDVVIFWWYAAGEVQKKQLHGDYGGWLLLPKLNN